MPRRRLWKQIHPGTAVTVRGSIGNIHHMTPSAYVCAMFGSVNLMQEKSKGNDMEIKDSCFMIIQYKEVIRI